MPGQVLWKTRKPLFASRSVWDWVCVVVCIMRHAQCVGPSHKMAWSQWIQALTIEKCVKTHSNRRNSPFSLSCHIGPFAVYFRVSSILYLFFVSICQFHWLGNTIDMGANANQWTLDCHCKCKTEHSFSYMRVGVRVCWHRLSFSLYKSCEMSGDNETRWWKGQNKIEENENESKVEIISKQKNKRRSENALPWILLGYNRSISTSSHLCSAHCIIHSILFHPFTRSILSIRCCLLIRISNVRNRRWWYYSCPSRCRWFQPQTKQDRTVW